MAHVEYGPSLIDMLRQRAIEHVMGISAVKIPWITWKREIRKYLGDRPDIDSVLDLGDRLSEIFSSTTKPGRSQNVVSGAGAAWEGLVCWYCNLCLVGSRTVVIKYRKSLVPDSIQKAITVWHGTTKTTSEADLIAITFPDIAAYKDEAFRQYKSYNSMMKRINELTQQRFNEHEVCVIQCKTNWNDGAQVPMLWNMIYSAKNFVDTNIHIGADAFSTSGLKNFRYAFVTVPSNTSGHSVNKLHVRRVSILTGGNYWGRPTKSGVAMSIKEIFSTNFSSGFNRGHREDLNNALKVMNTKYNYFDIS